MSHVALCYVSLKFFCILQTYPFQTCVQKNDFFAQHSLLSGQQSIDYTTQTINLESVYCFPTFSMLVVLCSAG